MKKTVLIALLFCWSAPVFGQIDVDKFVVATIEDSIPQEIMLIAAYPNNGFFTIGLKSKEAFPNHRDSAFEAPYKKRSIGVLDRIDSSDAHLFVKGIYRANANNYEFRIIENNNNVIVPWQTIHQFAHDSVNINNSPKGIGYLGGYKTKWDKYLVADIRKKSTGKIIASMAMYGQQIKPVLLNIYTNDELNQFLSTVKLSFPLQLDQDDKKIWTTRYAPNEIDSITFLPKKLILEPKEKEVIFLLNATIFPKGELEYKIMKDKQILTDWQTSDNYDNFIRLKNLEHGEYKLLIRFGIQRHNVLEYPFQVKPEWYQTARFQMILGSLSFLLLLVLLPSIIYLQQRQKLKKQKQLNEKIVQELKSIRSQLNPHFVFNAMSSIQGLMNKGDLTNANYYLTEFSALLRDSLLSNEKEYVPLSMELKTLETYIKLERLRFPFSYSLDVDTQLDTHAIEIPYLLLQPLVENAIKHGVSNLYEKGVLSIHIYPKNKGLVVEIKDNGKGFDTQAETKGYGLKLTKERVRLLSESNMQQAVQFLMESDGEKGTTVYLLFKNWL